MDDVKRLSLYFDLTIGISPRLELHSKSTAIRVVVELCFLSWSKQIEPGVNSIAMANHGNDTLNRWPLKVVQEVFLNYISEAISISLCHFRLCLFVRHTIWIS